MTVTLAVDGLELLDALRDNVEHDQTAAFARATTFFKSYRSIVRHGLKTHTLLNTMRRDAERTLARHLHRTVCVRDSTVTVKFVSDGAAVEFCLKHGVSGQRP